MGVLSITTVFLLFQLVRTGKTPSILIGRSMEDSVTRDERVFSNGAVASEQEKCSQVGRDILRVGGNAVDAAIATLLCIGVINNFSSGLGG